MTADEIIALADAVAERLRPMLVPPSWPADRPLLREPELAALMAVGHEKLVALRRTGEITYRRVGCSVMYSAEDLAKYFEKIKQCEAG